MYAHLQEHLQLHPDLLCLRLARAQAGITHSLHRDRLHSSRHLSLGYSHVYVDSAPPVGALNVAH